ncbi:MAG: DUF6502 family protein, partial [Thiohalomonadales bacterium]
DIRSTILAAVGKMFRPLVRVLLKYQISYGEIANLLRRTYVEVAHKDFAIPNKKSTYSKVAVMTGIDRKMVQDILNQDKGSLEKTNVPTNKGLSIVKTWTTAAEYLGKNNKPIVLPLRGELSFESLVKKACADFSPRSLLDELIRVGVVEKMQKNQVKLLKRDYVPAEDEQQLIEILLACAKDLLVTGAHNVNNASEDRWFQREVQYNKIPVSTVDEFKEYSNTKSEELLSDLNRWLDKRKKAIKANAEEKSSRIGLGIYYIETDNNGE